MALALGAGAEAIGGTGILDAIGGLFGLEGAGAGATAGLGAAEAGAGAAGAAEAGAGAAGAADIAGLLGSSGPSVLGTAADFLSPGAAAAGGLGGAPSVLGTAADVIAAPQAVGGATELAGFGAAADAAAGQAGSSGLASGTGGITAGGDIGSILSGAGATPASSSALPAGVANANAGPIPGIASGTPANAPSIIPSTGGGGGAAGVVGPSGAAPVDATALQALPGTAQSPQFGPIAPTGGTPPTGTAGIASLTGGNSGGLLDKIGNSLTNNIPGIALGAAGLGYNILQGQKDSYNKAALTTDANIAAGNSQQMVQSGEALQQYLTSGTLPPAYQQQVDQAIADAKTQAISNAASQGQSTDPTQNTSLAASLAKIEASKAGMQTQVASQLFSSGSSLVGSGIQSAGLSGQLFQSLVANDTTQAANTGKAIAALAAAMNGKSQASIGGQTITVGS
jgi:hypothetical protein